MQNADPHIIRGYKPGDEKEITALFREVFGKAMSIDQWKWKYLIPGNGKIYSKVAEDTSGNIIGHAGAIPLYGVFRNTLMQFFQIADVMVHTKARGLLGRKNVFHELIKSLFEDIKKDFPHVFCYGFPGIKPYILGERIKVYERIEQAVECVKILRHFCLTLYRVKQIDWNDPRLDDLWKIFSHNLPLALIRDQRFLNVRYATSPFFSYKLLGFFLFKKLVGWVVIRYENDEAIVVDLLIKPKQCTVLLRTLEGYLTSQGKRTVRLWLPGSWRQKIKEYECKATDVVVTNMIWKLPLETPTVRGTFFYTMGDTDIF